MRQCGFPIPWNCSNPFLAALRMMRFTHRVGASVFLLISCPSLVSGSGTFFCLTRARFLATADLTASTPSGASAPLCALRGAFSTASARIG
jgi:hypothetical protein